MSNNETIEKDSFYIYVYIPPLDPSFDNKADPSCKPHQTNSFIVSDPKDLTLAFNHFLVLASYFCILAF